MKYELCKFSTYLYAISKNIELLYNKCMESIEDKIVCVEDKETMFVIVKLLVKNQCDVLMESIFSDIDNGTLLYINNVKCNDALKNNIDPEVMYTFLHETYQNETVEKLKLTEMKSEINLKLIKTEQQKKNKKTILQLVSEKKNNNDDDSSDDSRSSGSVSSDSDSDTSDED